MALIERAMPLGGGAGLNFSIVGSTEEPNNPKENTLWIETDTAIDKYQLSATEPTTRADGTALQTGDVWIKTYNLSSITIDIYNKSNNSVKVNCSNAYQYIEGVWTEKTLMGYIGGKWVNNIVVVIDGNRDIVSLNWYNTYQNDFSITKVTEGIHFGLGAWQDVGCVLLDGYDITTYTKMVIEVPYNLLSNNTYIGVASSTDCYTSTGMFTAYKTIGGAGTYELDISTLQGKHYIKIFFDAAGVNSISLTIAKLYFK